MAKKKKQASQARHSPSSCKSVAKKKKKQVSQACSSRAKNHPWRQYGTMPSNKCFWTNFLRGQLCPEGLLETNDKIATFPLINPDYTVYCVMKKMGTHHKNYQGYMIVTHTRCEEYNADFEQQVALMRSIAHRNFNIVVRDALWNNEIPIKQVFFCGGLVEKCLCPGHGKTLHEAIANIPYNEFYRSCAAAP